MTERFDYLVIGGGVAGLTFALKAAETGTVAVLFKGTVYDSATRYAQGGIAAVQGADDSLELHVNDTLVAGAGLCNKKIVEMVVEEGQRLISDLVNYGANFDKTKAGVGFDLHREGGHSRRRILHTADSTGYEIQRALDVAARRNGNISFFENCSCLDLITEESLEHKKVLGAYVLRASGEVTKFLAKRTLVAAGGAGQVFRHTTNPEVATGDGITLCYRAGCSVSNLEFFQFHPTSLYHPAGKSFLLTEALRGEGAILRTGSGEPFMKRQHPLADLAPRDIVARAIQSEIATSGAESVFLDISHREAGFVRSHFPMVWEKCMEFGFNLESEPVPIVPAAHYCCGGVICDEFGRTEIQNLYVAGETSSTGLHGANRLASNSLLEGLVYGFRAAESASLGIERASRTHWTKDWEGGDIEISSDYVASRRLAFSEIMSKNVGIVRNNRDLELTLRKGIEFQSEAEQLFDSGKTTKDLMEFRNVATVANLITRSAILRTENRGLHFSSDYINVRHKNAVDTVLRPDTHELKVREAA